MQATDFDFLAEELLQSDRSLPRDRQLMESQIPGSSRKPKTPNVGQESPGFSTSNERLLPDPTQSNARDYGR